MHIYKIGQFHGIALPFYVKSDSLVRNFSAYTNQSIKLPALVISCISFICMVAMILQLISILAITMGA